MSKKKGDSFQKLMDKASKKEKKEKKQKREKKKREREEKEREEPDSGSDKDEAKIKRKKTRGLVAQSKLTHSTAEQLFEQQVCFVCIETK
jgi:hypothetical protein